MNRYRAAHFRTTLLPFAALGDFAAIVQSARDGACDALAALLERRPVAAALENASPSLFARLQAELATGQIKPKTASSLLKYLSRMASRCTPFGLMSGVVPADMTEGAAVELRVLEPSEWLAFPRISYERTFRAVRESLRARIERSDDVCVRLSGMLERRGGHLKVMSFHHPSGHITPAYDEIAIDQPLGVVLECSGTWIKVSELASILSGRLAAVSLTEARHYLLDLLDCGVLQDRFYPCLDPLNAISPGTLEACGHDPVLMRVSRTIERASRRLSVGQMSRSMLCDLAARAAKELDFDGNPGHSTPGDGTSDRHEARPADGTALQIDMLVRASGSSVGALLVEEVVQCMADLSRLPRPANAQLAALKDEFVRKFGEDSIPLLRAVAPDDGLSLNPFVTSRPAFLAELPIDHGTQDPDAASWSLLDEMMLDKLVEAGKVGAREIVLRREDLEPFLGKAASTSIRSGFALCSAYRRNGKDDESGPPNVLLVQTASCGTAGSISARFAHLDARLEECYRRCFADERLDDVIDADILYLPSARLGNVSCRPPALEHQIPVFGYAIDDGCTSIELADLYLGIDPREGFVLTSRKLGKRVRPRLASAHNYMHPECAPVYQFLAMLRHQDSASPLTDLLAFAHHLPQRPAVRLGSLILSPRAWYIGTQQMESHRQARVPRESLRAHLAALEVSRLVRFGQGDNLITCDLERDPWIDLLLEEKELTLTQAVPEGYEPGCVGADGLRQAELVLQYVDAQPAPERSSQGAALVEGASHLHGFGHWNYLKLYGGPHAIDSWVGPVSMVADGLRREGRINAWHFVRYKDPDPHLRLRWRSVDASDRAILDRFLSSIAGCASPVRTSAETFHPETFRYGGPDAIEAMYEVFTIDSAFVARLLASEHAGTAEGRVKIGVHSARALAQGLGLDDRDISALWDMLSSSFILEFSGRNRSGLRKDLGGLWRKWRREILDLHVAMGEPLDAFAKSLAEALARSEAWGRAMTRSRLEICADVIHMHSNRLFLDHARESEMCSYALAFHLDSARRFR